MYGRKPKGTLGGTFDRVHETLKAPATPNAGAKAGRAIQTTRDGPKGPLANLASSL